MISVGPTAFEVLFTVTTRSVGQVQNSKSQNNNDNRDAHHYHHWLIKLRSRAIDRECFVILLRNISAKCKTIIHHTARNIQLFSVQ